MVLGLLVGVGMAISGESGIVWPTLITIAVFAGLSWLLSGAISRVLGKALSGEELQRIGESVLETVT